MPQAYLQQRTETVDLYVVDIQELEAPQATKPIHWLLLTSHVITHLGQARMILDFYRKRWTIEEFFRTLKSGGFKIEEALMSDPAAFMKFVALATIAAIVTQRVRAHDNPSGLVLADGFDPDGRPILLAICKNYEGNNPTPRQKNLTRQIHWPLPPGSSPDLAPGHGVMESQDKNLCKRSPE